jgi:hypothetical protein
VQGTVCKCGVLFGYHHLNFQGVGTTILNNASVRLLNNGEVRQSGQSPFAGDFVAVTVVEARSSGEVALRIIIVVTYPEVCIGGTAAGPSAELHSSQPEACTALAECCMLLCKRVACGVCLSMRFHPLLRGFPG